MLTTMEIFYRSYYYSYSTLNILLVIHKVDWKKYIATFPIKEIYTF